MDRLRQMQAFVGVVEAGSFVRAAELLSASKAAVSRHVGELESRLGVRLLNRTTRRLSLTEEGRVFHERCRELLAGVDDAESQISSRSGAASGLVRVNAPVTFGISYLSPLWGEFMRRNPKVSLDVTLADRMVDLIEEGYDLAVRIGTLPDSTLVSRRLSTTRMVLCASPRYLRLHGTPRCPDDLRNHSVIGYSYWSTRDEWHFDGPAGKVSVRTRPRMQTNNGDTCRMAALAHEGVILQPTFLVGPDLEVGTLVELMPQYRSIELGIYAVYPTRRHVAPKVRALVEFLADRLHSPGFPHLDESRPRRKTRQTV